MASLKAAISAKCKDCTYDSASPGSWRFQVEGCTVKSCALWEVRPITIETINLQRKGVVKCVVVDTDINSLIDSLEDEVDEVS